MDYYKKYIKYKQKYLQKKLSGGLSINEYTNLDNYEIGCLLSHLLSIKYAYDNNFNNFVGNHVKIFSQRVK